MKKIIIILTTAVLLASCSSTKVSDDDTKRQELQQYKQQVHELTQKIEVLEKELSEKNVDEVIHVKVEEITEKQFEHFIEVTGKVEAEYDVNVSPESIGIIDAIYVTEGQRVSKGQAMATLRTDALQHSADQLKIQLDLATTNFERQKNLWDQNIGSEMQFLQAKTNMESLQKQIEGMEAQLEMSEIKSPVNGVVDDLYQEKGQIGSPQSPFAKIINIDKIKVYADVSETYLTKVKTGDEVSIELPAINKELKATIQQIGNVIDPNNRTFRIRLNLGNPDKLIKPNMASIIKIRDYVAENAVVVPSLYVKDDFKGEYTYIVDKQGDKNIAKKIYVTTGVTNNNMTEVTTGLNSGMKIISEGYNQIADGTVIQF